MIYDAVHQRSTTLVFGPLRPPLRWVGGPRWGGSIPPWCPSLIHSGVPGYPYVHHLSGPGGGGGSVGPTPTTLVFRGCRVPLAHTTYLALWSTYVHLGEHFGAYLHTPILNSGLIDNNLILAVGTFFKIVLLIDHILISDKFLLFI